MLVAEQSRRSRPTVLYGILAQSALSQLANTSDAKSRFAYFQNLIRLLDLYRLNTLHRPAPKAVLDRRRTASNSIRREKTEADQVQSALSRAHNVAYHQLEKEELVDYLKVVFLKLSQGREAELAHEDLDSVKRFLSELARALKNS